MTEFSTSTASRWFALRQKFRRHPTSVWILTLGFVAAAVALRYAAGPNYPAPFIPFYPAVLASTLIGGRWPGYLSLAASLAAAGFLFYDLAGHTPPTNVAVALMLFAFVALSVIEILVRLTSLSDTLLKREEELLRQGRDLTRREEQASARLGELEAIYGQAPIGLAFLDSDLRFIRINPALADINGHSVEDHLGHCVWDLVPDLRAQAEPLLRQVLTSGIAVHDVELSGETAARPGVKRYWKESFYPVSGEDGQPIGVGVLCHDVTEEKLAQEGQELLMHEVDHRAKNLLAVVQAVVYLSSTGTDPKAFKASILERIQGLARVHELISRNRWTGVLLDDILQQEVAPYGGSVELSLLRFPLQFSAAAAQALSMVLHELLTNSAKHGALSTHGRVELACSLETGTDPLIALSWRERDGPPVQASHSAGFGSKLIRMAVTVTLKGEIDYQLNPDGLECTIRFPVAACVSKGASPALEEST